MYLTMHLYIYISTYRDVTYFICSFYLPSAFPTFHVFSESGIESQTVGKLSFQLADGAQDLAVDMVL